MADEKDGKIVRNSVVAVMWEDTRARVENLGVDSTFLIYMLYTRMYQLLLIIKYNYYVIVAADQTQT